MACNRNQRLFFGFPGLWKQRRITFSLSALISGIHKNILAAGINSIFAGPCLQNTPKYLNVWFINYCLAVPELKLPSGGAKKLKGRRLTGPANSQHAGPEWKLATCTKLCPYR